MGLWDGGTVGLWDGGTVGPWDGGTVGLWDGRTVRLWDCGTVGLLDCGTVGLFICIQLLHQPCRSCRHPTDVYILSYFLNKPEIWWLYLSPIEKKKIEY